MHLKENKTKPVLLLCNTDIPVLTSLKSRQLEVRSTRLNTASIAGSESYECQLVCLHYWRKDTTATTATEHLPLCFLPGIGPRADVLPTLVVPIHRWSPSDSQASGKEGVLQTPSLTSPVALTQQIRGSGM